MTSRYLREIPLRILHRKVGDEHVTLLQACYDNPIFHEEDAKDFRHSNGTDKGGKSADHGLEACSNSDNSNPKYAVDGHMATDYMHSLPPTTPCQREHGGISFRSHRRNRCRLILIGFCCLLVLFAVGIGLLVYLLGDDESTPPPPVITLDQVEGSLTIIDGPFSRYHPDYQYKYSEASRLLQNAFIFKMNAVFSSSVLSSIYNSTQIDRIGNTQGRVSLEFYIHTPPRLPVIPSLDEKIKKIVWDGLSGSLFVVDKKSLRLRIRVSRPISTSTPTPGQCLPVTYSRCMNKTDYNSWASPNVLGHSSRDQAIDFLEEHAYLLNTQCYGYTTDFICSAFFPQCNGGAKPILPCKKYCQDVTSSCKSAYDLHPSKRMPFSCDDLIDSDNPAVCRQNPFKEGECIPVAESICSVHGSNHTAFPNMLGDVAINEMSLKTYSVIDVINKATHCFKHSALFACTLLVPPCSGKPAPNHYIPMCASFCKVYRDRCEVFLEIFESDLPSSFNCSTLPDSPDPTICVGYKEAREPEIKECGKGEVQCSEGLCIKESWLCDGFQDCSDNSDEKGCATCGPDETRCSSTTTMCIAKSQSCDGVTDCYMSTDETYCVRLNPEKIDNVLEVKNSVSAQWEEVCKDGWTADMADLTCRQLGYKKALTTYFSAQSSKSISLITTPTNDTDAKRLQSYLLKGQTSCPSGFIVRLMCWDADCGSRPAHYVSPIRVVGGEEVRPGTWPFMASLHGGSAKKFFCGATILNSEWILTAAHCVGSASADTIDYWTIKTGTTRREAFSEYSQMRKPRALFPHPRFLFKTVQNDIALIQLEKPLVLNDYVRAICLPENAPEPGTRCYVVGWGKSEADKTHYQPALREVGLDVTSWNHCYRIMQSSPMPVPYALTKSMFCAGGTHAHDGCQGDSGGPLLCSKSNMTHDTDEWYQAGIVSWGVACAFPNIPGVYTNLTVYKDWIHQVLANNSRFTDHHHK